MERDESAGHGGRCYEAIELLRAGRQVVAESDKRLTLSPWRASERFRAASDNGDLRLRREKLLPKSRRSETESWEIRTTVIENLLAREAGC